MGVEGGVQLGKRENGVIVLTLHSIIACMNSDILKHKYEYILILNRHF